MAGKGAAPSGNTTNRRKAPLKETLKAEKAATGGTLPAGALGINKDGAVIQWHPRTVKWWNNWRKSPQSTRMLTEPDWDFLLDTALLHHKMWAEGRIDLAGELRQRVGQYGPTPESRARLHFEIEVPVASIGNPDLSNVTNIADRTADREALIEARERERAEKQG